MTDTYWLDPVTGAVLHDHGAGLAVLCWCCPHTECKCGHHRGRSPAPRLARVEEISRQVYDTMRRGMSVVARFDEPGDAGPARM